MFVNVVNYKKYHPCSTIVKHPQENINICCFGILESTLVIDSDKVGINYLNKYIEEELQFFIGIFKTVISCATNVMKYKERNRG